MWVKPDNEKQFEYVFAEKKNDKVCLNSMPVKTELSWLKEKQNKNKRKQKNQYKLEKKHKWYTEAKEPSGFYWLDFDFIELTLLNSHGDSTRWQGIKQD